ISGDQALNGLLDAMEDSLGIVKRRRTAIATETEAPPAPPAAVPPVAAAPSPPAPIPQDQASAGRPAKPAGWFSHRQPFPFRMGRFDPDHFLRLDRPGRLHHGRARDRIEQAR